MSSVNRRLFLGTGIGGAGLLATGCSIFDSGGTGGGGGGDGDGADGPSVTIAQTATIDSLDPHYQNNSQNILLSGLMEGLVMQAENGTDVIPALAESWDVSEDELTYTFHMREGATWSNGDSITANDALWSFQRLLKPTGAATGSGFTGSSSFLPSIGIRGAANYHSGVIDSWDEVGITAPDDSTVEIELESPNPDFLLNMTHTSMIVLHPSSVEADAQGWQQPENWVGNGPYVLTNWEPATIVEMEATPEYWDADNVQVNRVVTQLGGDSTANMLAFRSGDVDITAVDGTTLADDPELNLTHVEGYSNFYLQAMWGGHPAIQDQRVRRALSMAIDREALAEIDVVFAPGGSLIPDSVPGWSEELLVPYDVDGARALLEEAGVLDSMPGLRIQLGGEDPMMVIMQEGLNDALGMDVTIDILEAGVHSDTRWQWQEDESVMHYYRASVGGVSTMTNWISNNFGTDYVRQFSMPYEAWVELQEVQADESLDLLQAAARVEEILSTHSTPEAQEFAQLTEEATATLDEAERTRKYLDAALIREEMAYTVPLAWGSRMWVATDRINGLQGRNSPEGFYFKYLTVDE